MFAINGFWKKFGVEHCFLFCSMEIIETQKVGMESKPPQLTLSKRVGKRKPKHYVQAVHTTCPELWHVCFSMFLK